VQQDGARQLCTLHGLASPVAHHPKKLDLAEEVEARRRDDHLAVVWVGAWSREEGGWLGWWRRRVVWSVRAACAAHPGRQPPGGGRYGEIYGEMWGDMGRYGEIGGDMRRTRVGHNEEAKLLSGGAAGARVSEQRLRQKEGARCEGRGGEGWGGVGRDGEGCLSFARSSSIAAIITCA